MAIGGTWFVSRSGIIWDVAKPTVQMIHWPDVAESLAKQCRWNGHCRDFYSVAEHCILVSQLVTSDLRLHALLHDAHEAFLGDIIRPVKAVLGDALKEVEDRLDQVIYQAAVLDVPRGIDRTLIKDADMRALATERRDIMTPPPADSDFVPAETGWDPNTVQISPLPWEVAKRLWLNCFTLYYAEHHKLSLELVARIHKIPT